MRTWPSLPSCRADCETPVDHSRSDTSREGKQMTIFLHSARTISRIFVFEAGGLRKSKAVEIRPAPYHFGHRGSSSAREVLALQSARYEQTERTAPLLP